MPRNDDLEFKSNREHSVLETENTRTSLLETGDDTVGLRCGQAIDEKRREGNSLDEADYEAEVE